MNVLTRAVHINAHDCAFGGMLAPHALARLLQGMAADHAEVLGFGYEDLKKKQLLWVLCVLDIKILQMPGKDMDIQLETWPSSVNRLRATREFRATDSTGTPLVLASSDWLILDMDSRALVDITKMDNVFATHEERLLGKIARHKPGGNYTPVQTIVVPHSSLDINGHVNNTEYVRMSHDALYALGYTAPLQRLHLTFHAEVFLGDTLELRHAQRGEQHEIIAFRADSPVFSAVFA